MLLKIRNVVFILFASIIHSVDSACSPVEERGSAVLSCTVEVPESCGNDDILFWTIPEDEILASCGRTACTTNTAILNATISGSRSSFTSYLMIPKVLPAHRRRLEKKWECKTSDVCGADPVVACNKLEIYELPQDPTCIVGKNYGQDGELISVSVLCSTSKIYPEADCLFYRYTNSVKQLDPLQKECRQTGTFNSNPVYYSYECEIEYSLLELGAGNHTFEGRIYPRVTDGVGLTGVLNTPASQVVAFYLPTASYSCITEQKDGYFKGQSATCVCSLTDVGYPRGRAQWYKNDIEITQTQSGSTTLRYDASDLSADYQCKGESILGIGHGSSLEPLFAFIEASSEVSVSPSASTGNLHDSSNNDDIIVTCQVPKVKVSPGVRFSFSYDGIVFTEPQDGEDTGSHYKSRYNFTPGLGGVYKVTCRAINSIFSDLMKEEKTSDLYVLDAPQLNQAAGETPIIEAVMGETTTFSIEINGYPEPTSTTLTRLVEGRYEPAPEHHTATYNPVTSSYGMIEVTLRDTTVEDYTTYNITVDNGVGVLVYSVIVNEAFDDGGDSSIVIYVLVAVVVVIVLLIIISGVILYRKGKCPFDIMKKSKTDQTSDNKEGFEGPDEVTFKNPVYASSSEIQGPRVNYENLQVSKPDPTPGPKPAAKPAIYPSVEQTADHTYALVNYTNDECGDFSTV